jgi:hypothetical protein
MLLSSSSLDFTLYLIFLHHHFELSVILYAPSLISFHVNLFYTIASDFLVEANRTHGDLISMRELPLLQSGLIWKKVWSTLISRSFLEQIFKGLCSQGFFIQGWESRSTGAASRYFTCYSGLEEQVYLKMSIWRCVDTWRQLWKSICTNEDFLSYCHLLRCFSLWPRWVSRIWSSPRFSFLIECSLSVEPTFYSCFVLKTITLQISSWNKTI